MFAAREAPGDVRVSMYLEAIAIKLDLVNPILRTGGVVHLGCEQGFYVAGARATLRLGELSRVELGGRVDALDVLALGLWYARHASLMIERGGRSRRLARLAI